MMFGDAEEQWGDPDERLLDDIKKYGHISGSDADGNQWHLYLWIYGDDNPPKGCTVIEIKGVKLWYELRQKADLPPLPLLPTFKYEPQVPPDAPPLPPAFPQQPDGVDGSFYKWNIDESDE